MQLYSSAHVDTFCRDHLPPAEQWPELLFTLPELEYPERLNCAVELLDRTIERHDGDRRCLLSPAETWSYADLRRHADGVARVLVEDLGLAPGNRVLLRGPNTPWLVACWFGVVKAGGVAMTSMPQLRSGELSVICEMGRVELALCDHRFVEELAAAQVPDLRIVTYGSSTPGDLTVRAGAKPLGFSAVDTAADDVALLAFTSGTTGRPKAAMHFHRDVMSVALTFSRHVLRPVQEDLFTGTPPLAFAYGLGSLLVFPLQVGAATLLLERTTPDAVADAVAEHRATVLFTAPTAYRAMLAAGKAPQLSSLRRCVSAGEHLPRAVWEAFHAATGLRLIDGLGSTEMLHVFVSAADDDIRPGSTGKAVPGYLVRVVDALNRPVPDGQVGRLAVKGPTGCRYLADPRQTAYVSEGWNITGDAYMRDADGYFWYQSRSDDMIVSAGYNIAGPEVETALLRHPDVVECGVVGAPDQERGTVVTAFVVLGTGVVGDDAKAKELQDHVKATIAPYKYPRRIEFIDALPRTSTGKLQRFRLRDMAKQDSTGPQAAT